MSRYVLSLAAHADLEQIWDYTCERWDDDQAEEYVREIQRAIARGDLIDVVRVLHQRMDVDRHLD